MERYQGFNRMKKLVLVSIVTLLSQSIFAASLTRCAAPTMAGAVGILLKDANLDQKNTGEPVSITIGTSKVQNKFQILSGIESTVLATSEQDLSDSKLVTTTYMVIMEPRISGKSYENQNEILATNYLCVSNKVVEKN